MWIGQFATTFSAAGPARRPAAKRQAVCRLRSRATLVSMFAGVLLSSSVAAPASADEWCDTDPVVVIKTPRGSLVPVFVNTGAKGAEHLATALAARMEYGATSTASGRATKVKLTVTVPPDVFSSSFETRSVVSTGAFGTGTRYAESAGTSGQTMKMEFELPVP